MVKPLIVPKVVIISLIVMILGATLAVLAYIYETSVLHRAVGELLLYALFADAFKIGLGALIGVLSQWAGQVFTDAEERHQRRQSSTQSDAPTKQESTAGEVSAK